MVAATFAHSTGSFATRLARLRRIAWLLDAQFALPGMRFRFGINALIGLAPGIGDALLGLVSLYIVNEAREMGVPTPVLGRMLGNIAIEVIGGSVPLLGDLFDAAFKANLRNLALIEDWAQGR